MKKLLLMLLLCLTILPGLAAATVTGTNTNVTYACTPSSTGPFAFTFPAFDLSGIAVIETTAAGAITVLPSTAYTGTPVNNSYMNGGSVTLGTACPSGDTLTIQRETEDTQLYAFTEYMPALYQTFESALDKLTMEVQDIQVPVLGQIIQPYQGGTGLNNSSATGTQRFDSGVGSVGTIKPEPSTYAGLPAPGILGRIYNVTNLVRGLWMDMGSWWASLGAEHINAEIFGVLPTNTAAQNDTGWAAIVAALNAFNPPAVGAVVDLPPGVLQMSQPVVFPALKYVRLNGAGMQQTVLAWEGANSATMFTFTSANSGQSFGGFEVSNLAIGFTAATGVTGLQFGTGSGNNITGAKVGSVYFLDLAVGVKLVSECDFLSVRHSLFQFTTIGVSGTAGSISSGYFENNEYQAGSGVAFDLVGTQHTFISNTCQSFAATMICIRLDYFNSAVIHGLYYENAYSGGSASAGPAIILGNSAYGGSSTSGATVDGFVIDMGGAQNGQIGIQVNYADGAHIGSGSCVLIALCVQFTTHATHPMITGPINYGTGVTTKFQDLGSTMPIILDPQIGLSFSSPLNNTGQPAFSAYLSPGMSAVTGDGTTVTVVCNTTTVNQGSGYNTGTGIFTAPVAGNYLFIFFIALDSLTSSHTIQQTWLVTTAKSYSWYQAYTSNPMPNTIMGGSLIVPMASGATAYLQTKVGGGAKVVDVSAAGTYFSGALLN